MVRRYQDRIHVSTSATFTKSGEESAGEESARITECEEVLPLGLGTTIRTVQTYLIGPENLTREPRLPIDAGLRYRGSFASQ